MLERILGSFNISSLSKGIFLVSSLSHLLSLYSGALK